MGVRQEAAHTGRRRARLTGTSDRANGAPERFTASTTKPSCFFFLNDTATTEIYTLSLHDALPISAAAAGIQRVALTIAASAARHRDAEDRKSTRLNSSHDQISYAVFCLTKKK